MPSTFERQPTNVAETIQKDRTFANDANGNPIARERVCECGQRFTQRLLSERFLAMVERRGPRAMELMTKQVPGFFVPVHCPKCERVDLGRRMQLDEIRSLPDHYQDKDHAAD